MAIHGPDDIIKNCPNCGSNELWRDCADVGIGVIFGPWGCADCCWSEDEEYDLSDSSKLPFDEKGGMIDQYGSYYPPENEIARQCYSAYKKEKKDD